MLNALQAPVAIGLFIFGAAGATAQSPVTEDFNGLVDIGGGRTMYLECRGAGSPTVLLVSGKGNRADIWSTPNPDKPGPTVFADVAKLTRACAYDRPGTTGALAAEPSRSDAVPEPVTIANGAADLHALLAARRVPGPYVLAGHSIGGLISRLFASEYGDEVAGLVLVDALSEDLYNGLTAEQRAVFERLNGAPERYDNIESFEQIRAAAAVRPMPVVVLTAGRRPITAEDVASGRLPPDVTADFADALWAAQVPAQDNLAKLFPNAKHVTVKDSGHYIQLDRPQLVVDSIRNVLDAVRDPATWPGSDTATDPGAGRDFTGLIDIGGGRKMHLECRGSGSPTVVLVSGKGNSAADWNAVLDPADPAHDARYDLVGAGQGSLRESESAVLPAVSRFTRVCAYDRPGTRIDGDDISTPVAQPHRVDQAVSDLRMLLAAAGETGPYLLVPHSYGGLVALLYARTHPDEVAGLVMVDAATELMQRVVSAEAMAGWDASNKVSMPEASEAVELLDAFEKIDAAPPLPERPAIVLSAEKPWQPAAAPDAQGETAGGATVTFADWLAAQDLLAASLNAKHVTETRSGHHIFLYEPQLVVDAVREVVGEVRSTDVRQPSPGLVDIDGGRKMYLDCRGTGSPTVVLVAGLKASADDWNSTDEAAPTVFAGGADVTRVCAYDRPGTPVGEQPSRSDAVPQPTTAADAVADLHALLGAAREPAPYVLVGHSYGGLIAKLYARTYPRDAAGLVLVDALTEGLQDAETPAQWATQRVLMEGDIRESVALYPALERINPDRSFDQVRAAPPLSPLPLVVLSADRRWGPQVPALIADGTLPADVPADFGYITDAAQKKAQAQLATLVPGARHITNTNSGHEIHKEQPGLVTDAIIDVVDAVRAGKTRLGQ